MKPLDIITSPQSKRIKTAAKLNTRRGRRTVGRFLVEGPQAVREALARHGEKNLRARRGSVDELEGLTAANRGAVVEMFITEAATIEYSAFIKQADRLHIPWHYVAEDVLTELTSTVNSQGIVLVCESLAVQLTDVVDQNASLLVVLSQVRDPGNAGTVIRVADAAGADAVIITASSVDVYNDKTVRATAGSLFHIPVVTGVGLSEVTELARARGMQVLAADAHPGAHDLHKPWDTDLDLSARTTWVFGNEAWGMPEADRELCDRAVAAPIYGKAESLNLGTAAAVCIYESARNHHL